MRRALTIFILLAASPALGSCGGRASDKKPASGATVRDSTAWPRTVDAAVDTLLAGLSTQDRDRFRRMSKDSLIFLHFGLGTNIRNDYGLWRGNVSLLTSCGQRLPFVPDDCSMLIIKRAWERLQSGEHARGRPS